MASQSGTQRCLGMYISPLCDFQEIAQEGILAAFSLIILGMDTGVAPRTKLPKL